MTHEFHLFVFSSLVNLKNVILQLKTDISYGVLSPKNGKMLIDGVNDVINPALIITKSAAPITYNAAEQLFTYTYTVTNSGNVNLSGITVTDTTLNQQISISSSNLAPGKSATGTATYTTAQSDVDNGSMVNTATASCIFNNNLVSNTTIATINAIQRPALTIQKLAATNNPTDSTTYNALGQTITYTYFVVNPGNVNITAPITVIDDKIARSPITIQRIGTLCPGNRVSGTATYTITQSDIGTGSVTNQAFATGSFNQVTIYSTNTATRTVNAPGMK